MTTGKLRMHSSRVASGKVGQQRVLLNLPHDRFIVLYPHAERIWDRIEAGEHDIAKLVAHHAQDTGTPIETAAFQVVTFLAELRAEGFVEFELPSERDTAPLVDVSLSLTDLRIEHVMQLLSGRRPLQGSGHTGPAFVVDDPDPALTLGEMRNLSSGQPAPAAPVPTPPSKRVVILPSPSAGLSVQQIETRADVCEHSPHFSDRLLVTLHAPSPDLRLEEIEKIARLDASTIPESRRGRVAIMDNPRGDLTMGDLETSTAARSVVVVVVVIVLGPIIVIVVVVIDGGGPSAGKSRSACKTMCV